LSFSFMAASASSICSVMYCGTLPYISPRLPCQKRKILRLLALYGTWRRPLRRSARSCTVVHSLTSLLACLARNEKSCASWRCVVRGIWLCGAWNMVMWYVGYGHEVRGTWRRPIRCFDLPCAA
jgi:hypothetical protein